MRLSLALVFLVACNESSGNVVDVPPEASTNHSDGGADASAERSRPHAPSDALRRCAESKGDIHSIADAVARLNQLAPNGDGPCFVATLPRPLAVVATLGVTSAQPAAGRGSPRLFFMLPKLVISAVPAGTGSEVLEFGEWVGSTRTLKGEIGLPVTAPLSLSDPFLRVLQNTNDRTLCALCHRNEEPHPTIPNGFVSAAFKPEPSSFMTVKEMEELHFLCTEAEDPGSRCAMIHALFDFGEVTDGAFSPAVETFFRP